MIKRILSAVTVFLFVFCSAGCENESNNSKEKIRDASSVSLNNTENKGSSSDKTTDKANGLDTAAYSDIGENGDKTITGAYVYSPDKELKYLVSIEDINGRMPLQDQLDGLVGAPINVDFDVAKVHSGKLILCIDKNRLNGVRPDALLIMRFINSSFSYEKYKNTQYSEQEDGSLRVTADIDTPGYYVLVNKYAFLRSCGEDVDDDGLEEGYDLNGNRFNYDNWAANANTGSIPDMVDTEYLENSMTDNGAVFEVSTPEQLATACYYVNCFNYTNTSASKINFNPDLKIVLLNDIDLKGIDWAPIGWEKGQLDNKFLGTFDGQGHTIKNLSIKCEEYGGLFGYSQHCIIKDLTILNADINSNSGGVLSGRDSMSKITNVYCSGKVTGEGLSGAICGDARLTAYRECKANVIVNGGNVENKYFSGYEEYINELADEYGRPVTIKTKGTSVVRPAGIEQDYENLGWAVLGELDRVAENETEFDLAKYLDKGEYKVYLEALIDGEKLPISNEVTIKIG